MDYNKKALETNVLIGLIITILSLIVILFVFGNFIKTGDLETKRSDCSFFLDQVSKSDSYFRGDDTFENNFFDSLANICVSEKVEISKNNVRDSMKLVQGCYNQMGRGVDFFPTFSQDIGVCFYCGELEFNSIDSSEFFEKFEEVAKRSEFDDFFDKEYETDSTIGVLRENNLKFNFDESNNLAVFYYAKRFDSQTTEQDMKLFFGSMFSSVDFAKGFVNSFFDSPLKTKSGVFFGELNELEVGQFEIKTHQGSFEGCDLIVPNNHIS